MPERKKLRVVIDTNLLISAAIVINSPPDKLITAWLKKAFIMLISAEQLEEIKDVSRRGKIKAYPLFTKRVTELIENIEFVAENIEQQTNKDLPIRGRDPEDDYLLAIALAGNADYLITGDQDLLVLNEDPALGELKIISVAEFLKSI